MNEFESVSMPADCVPENICAECAAKGLFHRPTQTAAAYCEHSRTGAVYPLYGKWMVIVDIDVATFREALVRACTITEIQVDGARATKH
jgi:hypothetical protein